MPSSALLPQPMSAAELKMVREAWGWTLEAIAVYLDVKGHAAHAGVGQQEAGQQVFVHSSPRSVSAP